MKGFNILQYLAWISFTLLQILQTRTRELPRRGKGLSKCAHFTLKCAHFNLLT